MKAISPVIATVIIVAITIAVAIAVALWISGLTGAFTGTENLQIVSAYATANTGGGWTITLEARNVGTMDSTIDQVFINGKPYATYSNLSVNPTPSIMVRAGETKTITISVGVNAGFTSGQLVEVKLHTASGKEYPKMVTLP